MIRQVMLEEGDMRVAVLSWGAVTQGWWLRDQPLILGYDNPQDYLTDPYFVGAIVGRVANRIGGAHFNLNGTRHNLDANEGANTLHGGAGGLSRRNWSITQTSQTEVRLNLSLQHGEDGFPGLAEFSLRITLQAPRLTYSFAVQVDRPSPISLAQHNYYTLGSEHAGCDSLLQLDAGRILEIDDYGIPTGRLTNLAGHAFDFRNGSLVRDLDHFFVFDADRDPDRPVARISSPTGLKMNVITDQPGAQVYAGAGLGAPFSRNGGLCIEPSGYPDAVNNPGFPSIIATPEMDYKQILTLEILQGAT